MHHVLVIPEVLGIIFRFTDTPTDARCARVHKAWKEEALNALWVHIRKPQAFLHALGTTVRSKTGTIDLKTSSISLKEWDRFAGYACRVRSLDLGGQLPNVGLASMTTIAALGLSGYIFPSLRHLSFTSLDVQSRLPVVRMFLHPGLQRLSIHVADDEELEATAAVRFLPYIAEYSPHLTHLVVQSSGDFLELYHLPLSELFLRLHDLKSVTVSPTAVIMHLPLLNALTARPHLQIIRAEGPAKTDTAPVPPLLSNAPFPSLTELSLEYNLLSIRQILQSSFPASRLRKLHITSCQLEPEALFTLFIQAVGETCHGLEDLSIVFSGPRIRSSSDSVDDSFASALLTPLKSCTRMTRFKLDISNAIKFAGSDIKSLIHAWPDLHTCTIRYPTAGSTCLNTDDLLEFARGCPGLEQLELVIDFSVLPSDNSRTLFKCLRRLHLSLSVRIYDTAECALFFAETTRPFCQITGSHFPMSSTSRDGRAAGATSPQTLTDVLSILSSTRAIYARNQVRDAEYRLRIEQLETHILNSVQ